MQQRYDDVQRRDQGTMEDVQNDGTVSDMRLTLP